MPTCIQALTGGCWRQARSIAEHMRTLDDMQQRLETGVRPQSTLGDLVGEMIDPLTGVGRLLNDMKRQVTGFAIESGFSGPGRCVPGYLVEDACRNWRTMSVRRWMR
jgi:hypothetical protein